MKTSANKPGAAMSRRAALRGGVAVAGAIATTGLPGLTRNAMASFRRGDNIAYELSEDHWANLIGEVFRIVNYSYDDVDGNAPRSWLRLSETSLVRTITEDVARPDTLRDNAISLVLRGPLHTVLDNCSYRLKHPMFGQFDLLVTRIKSKKYKRNNVYEAIINN